MTITQKRLKQIIAEEMEKLSETPQFTTSYQGETDRTAAGMEGSDHLKLLNIIQAEGGIRTLLGAISTLPPNKQDQIVQGIMNPMGADGKTPQWEAHTRTKKRK